MKEMICIVCPNGCLLRVDETSDGISVTGNKCIRGIKFGVDELTNPLRSLSSTVKTSFKEVPVLPVRTDKEFSKHKIFEVMDAINTILVDHPVSCGDILVENIAGTHCNLIVTSDLLSLDSKH